MQLPVIRPMTLADIDEIVAAFLHQDWGDRRVKLEFAVGHAEMHPFAAESDGAVVGTGIISLHGPVAWTGTMSGRATALAAPGPWPKRHGPPPPNR